LQFTSGAGEYDRKNTSAPGAQMERPWHLLRSILTKQFIPSGYLALDPHKIVDACAAAWYLLLGSIIERRRALPHRALPPCRAALLLRHSGLRVAEAAAADRADLRAGRDVKPDVILSSPALRALTTAQLVAGELGYATRDIVVDERLNTSSAESLLSAVRALDNKLSSAMVFGHNPEMSELASGLSGSDLEMVTCAVAEFRYHTKVVGRCRSNSSGPGDAGHAKDIGPDCAIRLPRLSGGTGASEW